MAARSPSAPRLARLARHVTAGAAAEAAEEPAPDVVVDEQALRALCRAILGAIGSSEEEQHIVADHLVEAMLKGHDSHGVQMLSGYGILLRCPHPTPAAGPARRRPVP